MQKEILEIDVPKDAKPAILAWIRNLKLQCDHSWITECANDFTLAKLSPAWRTMGLLQHLYRGFDVALKGLRASEGKMR